MIVGIDLGTTNSLVAAFIDGQPQLIPNSMGHMLTPSAVAVTPTGELVAGLAAREIATSNGKDAAIGFKRWMGSDKLIRLGRQNFRAEELSALVLRSLVNDAESFLGERVKEAVITVPAYFNEAQRRATASAAELAGLAVKRLVNEPTAAGLAYGLQTRQDFSTFLVVDLGGGTFDVSIVEYFDDVIQVRASAGDTRLGGDDFVEVVIEWLLDVNPELEERTRDDIRRNQSLWRTAEQLKRDLSDSEKVRRSVQYGAQANPLDVEFTREEFEARCGSLLGRIRKPIERALSDAKIDAHALSEVLLVGGATRMPMVRQLMTRLFHRLPLRVINPDEAIVRGAAIQAALCERSAGISEVVLTDVMPYSLGISASHVQGGRRDSNIFVPILERNMPVPVSRMKQFSTTHDNQTLLRIDIRQGESLLASENLHLGFADLSLSPGPAGRFPIDVRFSYDASGLLEVDVQNAHTGESTRKQVVQNSSYLSESDMQAARERLSALKFHPRDRQENIYLIERAKRLFEERLGEPRDAIVHQLSLFEASLDTQDDRSAHTARASFKKFLDEIDKGYVL